MKRTILWLCALFIWSVDGMSQQRIWSQFNFLGGYQYFGSTYDHHGLSLSLGLETHGKGPWWGDAELGYMGYSGHQTASVPQPSGMTERLDDRRGNLYIALGPGFDLFSNLIDRLHVSAHVGYAIGTGEKESLQKVGKIYVVETEEPGGKGLLLIGRLGYDHLFQSSFVLGGYLEAGTICKEMRWGIGLKLGYCLNDFLWKNPYGSR